MSTAVGLVIVACVGGIATGQVLFKYAAQLLQQEIHWLSGPVIAVLTCAALIYGAATIGWVWALQYVALNEAYPFMALAFVVVPFAGWLIFGEPVNALYGLGVALIMAGIVCVGLSMQQFR